MHLGTLTPLASILILGACATADRPSPPAKVADSCDQAAGQGFVGRMATAEAGQALLAATRSRILRWVPPRTAVTMDYRFDRLTVSYDDGMTITRVSCG